MKKNRSLADFEKARDEDRVKSKTNEAQKR
jgi:hypothetical protein